MLSSFLTAEAFQHFQNIQTDRLSNDSKIFKKADGLNRFNPFNVSNGLNLSIFQSFKRIERTLPPLRSLQQARDVSEQSRLSN